MCSVIINKINKDLTNIIREYLLFNYKEKYNQIVKARIYTGISSIKSQYFYLWLKRNYSQKEMLIYNSPYTNTIRIKFYIDQKEIDNIIKMKEFDLLYGNFDRNNYIYYFINIFDIPQFDFSKIKDPKMLNLFIFIKKE